jgi:hypothetical protein
MSATTAKKATPATSTISSRLSRITLAMESAHQIIKDETGAPNATILITRNLKNRKGHFTPFTPWTAKGGESFNEIAFNLEYFANGEELLTTLLHEVAHSLNWKNGIKDCSANQYHNNNFKKQAEELGLKTDKDNKGSTITTGVTELGLKRWDKVLKIVDDALKLTATGEGAKKPKGRNTNLIKAMCSCENVIRLSRTVLEIGVTCNQCRRRYEEA